MERSSKRQFGVLVVDMLDYFLGGFSEGDRLRLIAAQVDALKVCAKYRLPAVSLEYRLRGHTLPVLTQELEGLPFIGRLTKNHDDGFTDTGLHGLLQRWNVSDLLLMGVNASACVLSTGLSAHAYGYGLHTAKQLMADASYVSAVRKGDTPGWFIRNGAYHYEYESLLHAIEQEHSTEHALTVS